MQIPTNASCLKPISGLSGTLVACDGLRLVSQAKTTFRLHIDRDFVKLRADGPTGPTPETPFGVYELVKNTTIAEMFAGSNFFTPDQLIELCDNHRTALSKLGGTFVPLEVIPAGIDLGQTPARARCRFVAFVKVLERELEVKVHLLSDGTVWSAAYDYYVVRPQASGTA